MGCIFSGDRNENPQRFHRSLLTTAALSLVLSGCFGGSSSSGDSSGEPPFDRASGFAQKGPFQEGASATIRPLDDHGEPAGEGISTSVGSWGEYQFGDIGWSGPSLVEVEGFYFDESDGNYSGETLTLSTVVEVDEDGGEFLGNINLISHLMGAGIRQRMAEADDGASFLDHVEAVADEIRDELEFIHDPRELNLFEQSEDKLLQHESGILATVSIGASFHDDLSELLAGFDNAWEDGELTDSFLDEDWESLQNLAAAAIQEGDFEQAQQWLKDNFSGADIAQQLSSVGGLAQLNACQPNTTTQPVPRLCMGHPQTSSLKPGDSAVYWFRAPYDGAFRFSTKGELSVYDTVVRLARSVDDEGEIGTARETKTHHDTNTVSSRILEEGEYVYIEVEAWSSAGFTDPEDVILSAHKQNEGSERRPAWIFPQHAVNPYLVGENMQHFVGSQHRSEGESANNRSFYRFMSWGFSTLRYYEHACGWESINGHTFVQLYRSNNVAAAFNDENLVASVNMQDHHDETGDCEVDLDLSPDAQYFVKVTSTGYLENQYQSGSMYSRPNATGSPTFNNAGRTVHFKGIND